MTNKISLVATVAMYAVLIAVVLHLAGFGWAWMALAASALVLFLCRLYIRARETNRNLMRLLSIQMFSAALMLAAAYLIYTSRRYWILPLVISSAVEFYVSFRISKEQQK